MFHTRGQWRTSAPVPNDGGFKTTHPPNFGVPLGRAISPGKGVALNFNFLNQFCGLLSQRLFLFSLTLFLEGRRLRPPNDHFFTWESPIGLKGNQRIAKGKGSIRW